MKSGGRQMKKTWMMAVLAAAVSLSGCGGLSIEREEEPTPTAAPTATPTAAPTGTPTPVPTATTAPRLIGIKTASSKTILLTNSFAEGLRELYIRISGSSEWNKNLIPQEAVIHEDETVTMCYTPVSGDAQDVTYDIRITTKSGAVYDIYGVNLEDMDSARLYQADDGTANLKYMSLSSQSEVTTEGYSYSDDSDSEDYDYNYNDYDYSDSGDYDYSDDSYDSGDYDYNDYDYDYSDDSDYSYDDTYEETYDGDDFGDDYGDYGDSDEEY
jgi:hypothetical protein